MSESPAPIRGYRKLSEDEIGLINTAKQLEELVLEQLACAFPMDVEVGSLDESKARECFGQANLRLKEGFMWFNRMIARPE